MKLHVEQDISKAHGEFLRVVLIQIHTLQFTSHQILKLEFSVLLKQFTLNFYQT